MYKFIFLILIFLIVLESNTNILSEIKFAEIIIPVTGVSKTFTYRIPEFLDKKIHIGCRVFIEFGNRTIIGCIMNIHNINPEVDTKSIIEIIDTQPILSCIQIKFLNWICQYYMSGISAVYKLFVPSILDVKYDPQIIYNQDFDYKNSNKIFNELETKFILFLQKQKSIELKKINSYFETEDIYTIIKKFYDQNILSLQTFKSLKNDKFKIKYLIIRKEYIKNKTINKDLLDELTKFPKQLAVILTYQKHITTNFKNNNFEKYLVEYNFFKKEKISQSSINTLIKKNIFQIVEKETIEHKIQKIDFNKIILSPLQNKVYYKIKKNLRYKKPILFHGITGSGKTEIYIKLILDMVQNENKSVLFLLPEIALTNQLLKRLKTVFGCKLGIYHSSLRPLQKYQIWDKLKKRDYQIIIGTRSALFLPFYNLSLIIIDEEHDLNYKQKEVQPKYNARDCAIYLANLIKADIVLGSATPSIESYYNASISKYIKVDLNNSYYENQKSKIFIHQYKIKNDNLFNFKILNSIKHTLKEEKQIMVFQNRRGYAPVLLCQNCYWTPTCKNCSVNLVMHLKKKILLCHYCGFKNLIPKICTKCGSFDILDQGLGTEKIESYLLKLFPNAKTARLDLETSRKKGLAEKIISDFETNKIDILIGTQMITKGFDFSNLQMVIVPQFDHLLKTPDFKSRERCFQIISQVVGRCGRRTEQGCVHLQTINKNQNIFNEIFNDNASFYKNEISERQLFKFPPFAKVIKIEIKHKSETKLVKLSKSLYEDLKYRFKHKILGPQSPTLSKIRNYYIKNIYYKNGEQLKYMINDKMELKKIIDKYRSSNKMRININVDP